MNQYFITNVTARMIALIIFIAVHVSCVTPQQKKDLDDDIFRLQTRVLQLESNIASTHAADQKAGEVHHKTIASTNSDVERLNIDMKRLKGDIDALKVGIQTGQMPGQETPQDGSVAAQLIEIKARLEAVETQQKEILTTLERMDNGKKRGSERHESVSTSSGSINADSNSLKNAFDRKKYSEVVEDSPTVLKKSKGKEREQTLFIYGESLMKLNRHKEAALQFSELTDLKPGDKLMAMAKLRLGDAFKAMGDKETSKLFYDEVITKFAGTPEAEKARKALKSKKSAIKE